MVLQYIQHYLHTRIKQLAGCAQCASIDFLNVLHFVSARSGRMVLDYCIVHNVLLFLRSMEWQVLVQIFSRRRRFRAGFFHSSVCWKCGRFYEWSRMISNALVVIHIYTYSKL